MDALGVVAHQPGKPVPPRQGVDERSETHPLHDAPHGDFAALLGGRSHGVAEPVIRVGPRGHATAAAPSLCTDLLELVRRVWVPWPIPVTTLQLTTLVLHRPDLHIPLYLRPLRG